MFKRRSFLSLIASCIALGALPAVVTALLGTITPKNFAISVLSGTIYAGCIAIPCWALFDLMGCWLQKRTAVQRYAFMGSVLAVFAVLGCLVANLILVALGIIPLARFGIAFFWTVRICLLITFSTGTLTTVIMALQGQLRSTREQLQERRLAAERERKMAAEARYASLESRVRPHFLFNTLNSISALVREDPGEAERMIERLAALLRYSLDMELAGLVSVREELRIVRDYLEIERVRFGARLRYSIEADEAALMRTVPALSIQTVVENSVKYAASSAGTGAEIRVRAHVSEERLRVEVQDDGPGFDPAASIKTGHGLELLQRRLESFFGTSGALELDGTPGRTLVAISVAA